jgi:predicted 3-demethylubiquinone-9 3-methyltransferase (glyoxalase superfamily)
VGIFPNSKIGPIMHKENIDNDDEDNILTVSFNLDGQEYIGLNGGDQFQFTEAVSFSIACDSQKEIDYYWETLIEQGQEGQCGWLKDKFGLSWQVVPKNMGELMYSDNPGKAKRKMERMLGMKKIIIKELTEI